MPKIEQTTLANGLRVLVLPDPNAPLAVFNIMYLVGSRDEQAHKTGFAHLFEHLMFGGSANIPVYDEPLQRVGGENNAFTNTDITNYYIQIPPQNLETAFWLESDRMLELAFSPKSLDVQKGVVVEEFKQRYLNQPYGDAMHHLRDLAYKAHPYRWPTIGAKLEHIENAELEDVKSFFYNFYRPNNALLVVAGPVETSRVFQLAEKWFGPIPSGKSVDRQYPTEPKQTTARRKEIQADVPMTALYKAYHMGKRLSAQFYAANLLTDIIGHGKSSRFVDKLVKQDRIFHSLNAYITGSIDPGLLIIEGKINPGIDESEAEGALLREIASLKENGFSDEEIQKVKNQAETQLATGEIELLNKTINLAYFGLLGDHNLYFQELNKVQAVTKEELTSALAEIVKEENCSTLIYKSTAPQL